MNLQEVIQVKKVSSIVSFPIVFSFIFFVALSSGAFPVARADYRCEIAGPSFGNVYGSAIDCSTSCGGVCASVPGGGGSSGGSGFTPRYPTSRLPEGGNAPVTNAGQVLDVVVNMLNFAQAVFWVMAAGFGLYGAYLYLFSQGNKESVTQAKNMFIYMAVAIFVAIIAYGIPSIVVNFVDISIS